MKNRMVGFISLLLVAIFLLSLIPVVFAKNDTARPKLDALRENAKASVEKYQAAKEKYVNATQAFRERRAQFLQAKAVVIGCKENNSTECKDANRKIIADSKQFLLKTADVVLDALDKLKTKVQSSEDMSEDEMNLIIADIDAKIADVTSAKATIENLNNESTKEDIKEATKTITQSWANTRNTLKIGAAIVVNEKIGGVINRLDNLNKRLEKTVQALKDQGEDTSSLDSLLSTFSSQISKARQNYESAKQKYTEARLGGDVNTLMKEGNQYMKQAHIKLKEAHSTLKEITSGLREIKGGMQVLADTAADETLSADSSA